MSFYSLYLFVCPSLQSWGQWFDLVFFPLLWVLSVQLSHSVMSDSLWPHGLQHTRPPCPSPTPGAYPNSCPLSRWCQPTISPSVIPFSSCPQSFPASGSSQMSQLFTPGGQSFNISPSSETQDWSPIRADYFLFWLCSYFHLLGWSSNFQALYMQNWNNPDICFHIQKTVRLCGGLM